MYSRVLQLAAGAVQIVLAGCSTYAAAAPGISPDEMRALVKTYYWRPEWKPTRVTPAQLDEVLRASADRTLDGEAAESQSSRVAVTLADIGDAAFAQAVARQPDDVRRAVARDISYLWTHYHLRYPRTQLVLQPYI